MRKLLGFVNLLFVLALSLLVAACGGGGGGSGDSGSPASVSPAPNKSSNAEILSFAFTKADNSAIASITDIDADLKGNPSTVDGVAKVAVTYPFNSLTDEDLKALKPTITVSEGATISPASGIVNDFTNPVEYTVTAQDGSKKVWTVTVDERDATEHSIIYDANGGSMKFADHNVFKEEEEVTLPSGSALVKENYYFVGWIEPANNDAVISGWGKNTRKEDVTVRAKWAPAPSVKNKTIYANGLSLTVKDIGGKTMACFTGVNGGEIALSEINSDDDYQDLSGYTLYAGGLESSSTENFTVTMNGGNTF